MQPKFTGAVLYGERMLAADTTRPFGRMLTAMVTPFGIAGEVDLDAAADLARYLVDEQHNDGIVVNGTTGEAPTTTDAEKADLVRVVAQAVGDRAYVVAGVGTFDTTHSAHLAMDAQKAGADGLLVVTPYYSKPPQAGIVAHFKAVADSAELPVMLYDIPARTGVAIAESSLIALADHPRIVAVKDAKGDFESSATVLAKTDLAYYSGDDSLTLPLLSIGAVGVVGTSTHVSGIGTKAMIEAFERGDIAEALRRHRELLPIYSGIFRTQGCILVKAALSLLGRPVGTLRPPLIEATEHELSHLREDLVAAGLL
jgi:4-hydroxy-tetrahydrodipicolinate synthase